MRNPFTQFLKQVEYLTFESSNLRKKVVYGHSREGGDWDYSENEQ